MFFIDFLKIDLCFFVWIFKFLHVIQGTWLNVENLLWGA